MPKLTIDGIEVEVEPGLSVIQVCDRLGIEVPRFCYHDRLSISGNCRMCLVEMEKAPKLIAACAMPVADNMVIHTKSEKVKKARKGVMEFLLINHPLDCPICDQGGECDLQDQAVAYGLDRGRFAEEKRTVRDKNFGPIIKAHMTRCIQCTRCIRFVRQVAGVPDLGGIGRGEHMEIDTYVEKAIGSELSGNLVDVCPVGALTGRPYAYTARPWELRSTESIDVFDALGANIRVDARGSEVLRVQPRVNDDVNEEWLGDKSRYAIDGLKRQRLDSPYVRRNGKLTAVSWNEALAAVEGAVKATKGDRVAAIAGDMADAEAMMALKDLMAGFGSPHLDCRQDGAKLAGGARAGYIFNSTVAAIEQADVILLIGTNPRRESPVLNARIRKRYLKGGFKAASVGEVAELTYPCENLGTGGETLGALLAGSHPFAATLKAAKKGMIIIGQGALTRADGAAVLAAARKLAETCNLVREDWNGFNVLHTAAARVGGLDLGFLPGAGGKDAAGIVAAAGKGEIDVLFLLGADEIDAAKLGKACVVYIGSHGDAGANRADIILPGAAYTEKDATYVNTEGRVQRTRRAVFPPGEAKEDWRIVRALSDRFGKALPYDNLPQIRKRMAEVNPVFAAHDAVSKAPWQAFGQDGALDGAPFRSAVANYYMTDPISRCSPTMATCTATFVNPQPKTGTHG